MSDGGPISIQYARSADDLTASAKLFRAYAESLDINLAFQDFDAEMRNFPGKYAPPNGEILLARDQHGTAVGCVALRPIMPDRCCELKRLYISPAGRGLGIGRKMVDTILDVAGRMGYNEIKLDTLPFMTRAISLYKQAGFVPTAPYYTTPLSETMFYSRRLGIC